MRLGIRNLILLTASTVLLVLPSTYLLMAERRSAAANPVQVLTEYLKAVYARDYRTACQWISVEDRKQKSEADYLRENLSYSGVALELSHKVAEMIELRDIRTDIQGNRVKVNFTIRFPNANAFELQHLFLDFDPDRLAKLTSREMRAIEEKLEQMKSQRTIPMIEGEDNLELVRDNGKWRVLVEWAGAIRVRFFAEVKEGLSWEFGPVQGTVLARPGETLQAIYRVKNVSARPITAKARHLDEPKELAAKYLEIIQCFCFIQITLAPGEQKELPLVFRVHWDTPKDVKEFRVTYDFYPIEKFPQG